MAHLQGSEPERKLRLLRTWMLLALLVGAPGHSLRAQEGADVVVRSAPEAVGGLFEAGVRITGLVGEAVVLAGGGAGVALHPKVVVGGFGWVLLRERELPAAGLRPETDLGFGYAGVFLEAASPLSGPFGDSRVRVLIGAGNADQTDRATGGRLAADNFFVIEPELLVHWPLEGPVSAGLGASWRFAFDVDDLPDIDGGDLSGPSLSIGIRLGPF